MSLRAACGSISKGVVLLSAEYARGTNIKFKVDAKVYICCNGTKGKFGGTKWGYTFAMQAAGRGSRTGNISYAIITCVHPLSVGNDENLVVMLK
jgi:hypothetical protein